MVKIRNLKIGSSFLIEIKGKGNSSKKHAYVYCEGICKKKNVIIVPFQTIRNKMYDNTTVVKSNNTSYSFIKSDSYVAYYEAQVISEDDLNKKLEKGNLLENIPNDIFLKINKGIINSNQTDLNVKKCFENMKKKTCCEDSTEEEESKGKISPL